MPPVDLFEAPDRYVVTAEVAGLSRDDVQIHIQEGKLTLRGERPPHDPQSVRFERVERGHGRFSRTFVLPHPVDPAGIKADLQNGLLTIDIPKLFDHRRIDIDQG